VAAVCSTSNSTSRNRTLISPEKRAMNEMNGTNVKHGMREKHAMRETHAMHVTRARRVKHATNGTNAALSFSIPCSSS